MFINTQKVSRVLLQFVCPNSYEKKSGINVFDALSLLFVYIVSSFVKIIIFIIFLKESHTQRGSTLQNLRSLVIPSFS